MLCAAVSFSAAIGGAVGSDTRWPYLHGRWECQAQGDVIVLTATSNRSSQKLVKISVSLRETTG